MNINSVRFKDLWFGYNLMAKKLSMSQSRRLTKLLCLVKEVCVWGHQTKEGRVPVKFDQHFLFFFLRRGRRPKGRGASFLIED